METEHQPLSLPSITTIDSSESHIPSARNPLEVTIPPSEDDNDRMQLDNATNQSKGKGRAEVDDFNNTDIDHNSTTQSNQLSHSTPMDIDPVPGGSTNPDRIEDGESLPSKSNPTSNSDFNTSSNRSNHEIPSQLQVQADHSLTPSKSQSNTNSRSDTNEDGPTSKLCYSVSIALYN